ncbi:MAG: ribosomal RNA small subunit methyltransferase A [Opitutales bacterium]|nr:ribosomal RNA small subunit methyltransferase A [Opitutales bacterium]
MAFSLSETREILRRFGVCPKRKLGQNFLIDQRIVGRSVQWAQIEPSEVVIEVGSGCGTLTDDLVKTGVRVFAVEKDPLLARHIAQSFPIALLQADAVDFPVGNFDCSQSYKVVANLPYAIASVWLDKVLELPQLPVTMVLLVQKEAAERWFSKAGCKSFGAIGIYLQAMYRLEQKCGVSKRCFYPQPKVDSVLLHIQKRIDGYLFPKEFKQFIRELFTHRRQQIARACNGSNAPFADDFLNFLEKQNLPETVRAEAVPLELWIEFSKGYFSEHSDKAEFHHDV